jgi:hypothetical protein
LSLTVEVEVNLRPTVSRPVCLDVRRPSGTRDQFFFLFGISFRQLHVCYFVAPSLTRGLVCNLPYNSFEVKVTLRPTVSRPVFPGFRRPSGTFDQFFFLLEISFRQLRVFNFVAPSLTRGRVCNLLVQLLLGLARAVTLGSKSLRNHGYILLSHLRLPQPGGPGPRIYIPQEQGGPVIPPGTGFCFLSLTVSQDNPLSRVTPLIYLPGDPDIRVRLPKEGKANFSLIRSVHTGTRSFSYPMPYWCCFPGSKATRERCWPQLHLVLKLRSRGAVPPLSHTSIRQFCRYISNIILHICTAIEKFLFEKGVRGSGVGLGAMLQPEGRGFCISRLNLRNPSSHTMAPGFTKPLTETSTKNILWGGG